MTPLTSRLILKILTLFIIVISVLYALYQNKRTMIDVFYDKNIHIFSINILKNLRYVDEIAKKSLFQDFSRQFSVEKVIKNIGEYEANSNIVLWFTDHFGRISEKTIQWYKKNIFNSLSQSTFYLVDLAAWRFLSLDEQKLTIFHDFKTFINNQRQNINLQLDTCPLVKNSTPSLQIADTSSRYKALCSKNFFVWLSKLTHTIDPAVADRIIRNDLRKNSARFSLRKLGYQIKFLDIYSKKLGKNLLDADNTQIFPLLQYLEGVYYVLEIIKNHTDYNKPCNIIFLLPNKEFTYYIVDEEKDLFETFCTTILSCISNEKLHKKTTKIKIHFYPFTYGTTFYDQPYEEDGPYVSSPEILIIN